MSKLTYKRYRETCELEQVLARDVHVPDANKTPNCSLPTDSISMQILRNIGGIKNRRAVYIPGDGNCLFSTVSVAYSGSMQFAAVLRLLTAFDLGLNKSSHEAAHAAKQLEAVSPNYREACMDGTKNGAYSSTWHIQALANVLGQAIACVYPRVNGVLDSTADLLNTTFVSNAKKQKQPLRIMWTSGALPQANVTWTPNHFVPLVESFSDDEAVITLPPPSPSESPEEWPLLPESRKTSVCRFGFTILLLVALTLYINSGLDIV